MKKTLKMMVNVCLVAAMVLCACMPVLAEDVVSNPMQMVEETPAPSAEVTEEPELTTEPTVEPTAEPTVEPTVELTTEPTVEPTVELTTEPTAEPTAESTVEPTAESTVEPTAEPATEPATESTEEPAAEEPASEEPAAEPTPVAFAGTVTVRLENTGDIYFGDVITLRAEIKDANLPYTIRWEANDGNGWKAIPDENGEKYEFEVDEENATWEYRVVLSTIA